MAITVLNLIKGDENGSGKVEDYAFEPITLTDELEKTILEEMSNYELKIDKEENADHDEYGRYFIDGSTEKMPLVEVASDCFIKDGHFLGVKQYNALLFKNKTIIGNNRSVYDYWPSSRQINYCSTEYTLVDVEKQ